MRGSRWAAASSGWSASVPAIILVLLAGLMDGPSRSPSGRTGGDPVLPSATATGPSGVDQLPPTGQWVADLPVDDDRTSKLVVDLGRIGSDWVGEFDLVEFGVENYPVTVSVSDSSVQMRFAAIQVDFEGSVLGGGDRMRGRITGEGEDVALEFRRNGSAQFSEGFLALEAMALDGTLVEPLSPGGDELRDRFNRQKGKTRLVLLLSPT